jgi:predicted CoA-substrate-specific enzyme activase
MLKLGIDIGSTTVKTVISNGEKILFENYERHGSKVKETVLKQLEKIKKIHDDEIFAVAITGSAGLGLAQSAEIEFVQEVHASFSAVKKLYPDTDVVIELGGEDAKIIFFTGGSEQRMNGSCAGGTGAFIDQMATLLDVTPTQLDEMALKSTKTYPIASRCGVFAKSDIQPLLNQGAKREDVSASIYQAVVDQTVGGLSQGRKIQGKILFLGGPLFFSKGLQNAFIKTLKLSSENTVIPDNASTFVALGASFSAKGEYKLSEIIEKLSSANPGSEIIKGKVLFENKEDYRTFIDRHKKADVLFEDICKYEGDAYLGIDAGSTTTKMALITPDGKLLYQFYANNKGQPLDKLTEELKNLYSLANPKLEIKGSAVTGYGEELIKAGFKVDFGIVETVAHFKAAKFFQPDVDFIIDIGGQDIKCFKIKNNNIDNIMLNEACSSGCGSFIQSFASALGYGIAEFSELGLFAKNPVELGSRCTVFMNSSVKQAQKDCASIEDISAGLSSSVVKNAIYKVIRAKSVEELGKNIVVQGGTFLNDAVLRAFESELGINAVRPSISGLMGAFGAALYAKESGIKKSTLISKDDLNNFSYTSKSTRCSGCTNNCELNIVKFPDGRFLSGNKCEKPLGIKKSENFDMFLWKYNEIKKLPSQPNDPLATIGLPLCLEYYELLPLWANLFTNLGFKVVLSDESTRDTFVLGQSTIPSDTVCYPAKLVHGHIENMLAKGVDHIFYPCMTYNLNEGNGFDEGAVNHFNCPVMAYYPELLRANIESLNSRNFVRPYIDLNRRKNAAQVITDAFSSYRLNPAVVEIMLDKSAKVLRKHRESIIKEGVRIINQARKENKKIIVLAGRPYHIDPEINHGVQNILTSLGFAVITEDVVAHMSPVPKLEVINQWTYHSRLYRAANYVTKQKDMQLVQLISFGCGIDAITSDETRTIIENSGKIYTSLKIDEISNLGAAKIRLRSLAAAL